MMGFDFGAKFSDKWFLTVLRGGGQIGEDEWAWVFRSALMPAAQWYDCSGARATDSLTVDRKL